MLFKQARAPCGAARWSFQRQVDASPSPLFWLVVLGRDHLTINTWQPCVPSFAPIPFTHIAVVQKPIASKFPSNCMVVAHACMQVVQQLQDQLRAANEKSKEKKRLIMEANRQRDAAIAARNAAVRQRDVVAADACIKIKKLKQQLLAAENARDAANATLLAIISASRNMQPELFAQVDADGSQLQEEGAAGERVQGIAAQQCNSTQCYKHVLSFLVRSGPSEQPHAPAGSSAAAQQHNQEDAPAAGG